jgi:hypothetical protein
MKKVSLFRHRGSFKIEVADGTVYGDKPEWWEFYGTIDVQEPKKKVVKYRYAFQYESDWICSDPYYSSDEDFARTGNKVFQRIDASAKEFDE